MGFGTHKYFLWPYITVLFGHERMGLKTAIKGRWIKFRIFKSASRQIYIYINMIIIFNRYLTRQVSYNDESVINDNDRLYRPNPDDAGSIVRRPMGLPITAGC
jgi:hypothetical protein